MNTQNANCLENTSISNTKNTIIDPTDTFSNIQENGQ